MLQANLFSTGITCDVCGKDPELSDKNSAVWPGFLDADMRRKVCPGCRERHYEEKQGTEYAGMYSEVPIVIETEKIRNGR